MVERSQQELELDVVESINDVSKDEWNGVVERSSEGSLFHRYEWLKAIESGLDYAVTHLTIRKDSNLIGLYPNVELEFENTPFTRLTSLYPGFGGPVATTNKNECLSLFSESIPDVTNGRTLVHQIRACETSYLGYNNLLKIHGYIPTRDGCRFQIPLEMGYDEVWERMDRERQRRIERGREHEYEIVEEELTPSNIRQLHDTYAQVMDRVGGDVIPLTFLNQLRNMEERVLVLSLIVDGEYAGSVLELLDEEHSRIHGWLAAVPQECFEYNATELLYDAVIRWGIDNEYETYDLGYTASDASDGLYNFKKSFGGDIVPNLSWERSCSPVWPLARTGRAIYWSKFKSN